LFALAEGRLRDAARFRRVSLDTYRAQGVPIGLDAELFVTLESAIDAGAPTADALRAWEEARRATSPSARRDASLLAARVYAKLKMVPEAKAALAEFDRRVTNTTERAESAEAKNMVLKELAIAESRWAEAAAMARRADELPDGPASACLQCLPLELLRVFATSGVTDSAIAQYEIYKRTPNGSRPKVGPDLFVSARTMLALARIYDARGDRAKAVAAYRDYATRYERADTELQGTVREARARVTALMPGEREK
jgi:hypothetical protein